jgi:hypothetical protein
MKRYNIIASFLIVIAFVSGYSICWYQTTKTLRQSQSLEEFSITNHSLAPSENGYKIVWYSKVDHSIRGEGDCIPDAETAILWKELSNATHPELYHGIDYCE